MWRSKPRRITLSTGAPNLPSSAGVGLNSSLARRSDDKKTVDLCGRLCALPSYLSEK